jgi:osmotically-inducible protein OsmY
MMRPSTLVAVLFSVFLAGCSDNDAEKLRRVGDKTFDRVSLLAQQVGEELGQTLLEQKKSTAAEPISVVERVTQRLRWDRDLAALEIDVAQQDDGILLSGKVKSDAQKKQAAELAEHTLGVQKVQNNLQVEEKQNTNSDRFEH